MTAECGIGVGIGAGVLWGEGFDVFADGGYHETSVEAVAERAGVSKALIYEHFDSKRELHRALLERYVHELLARVVDPQHGRDRNADVRSDEILGAVGAAVRCRACRQRRECPREQARRAYPNACYRGPYWSMC